MFFPAASCCSCRSRLSSSPYPFPVSTKLCPFVSIPPPAALRASGETQPHGAGLVPGEWRLRCGGGRAALQDRVQAEGGAAGLERAAARLLAHQGKTGAPPATVNGTSLAINIRNISTFRCHRNLPYICDQFGVFVKGATKPIV